MVAFFFLAFLATVDGLLPNRHGKSGHSSTVQNLTSCVLSPEHAIQFNLMAFKGVVFFIKF
jgi:hypothetical protein